MAIDLPAGEKGSCLSGRRPRGGLSGGMVDPVHRSPVAMCGKAILLYASDAKICTGDCGADRPWHPAGLCLLIVLLIAVMPVAAQAQGDPADRLPAELHERLVPRVTPLAGEDLVVRSSFMEAAAVGRGFGLALFDLWQAGGGVVLDVDEPGLTVHFYAEGIEAMTLTDKLWEGLPRRAKSLQDLVDHTIGRARAERQPIGHLIITGHAGLPGCSALGGTMDDCTFRGRLSTYQRQQLARLRPYLAADAEIELRQCVTGSGKEGQRLLTAIYDVTDAATSSYLSDFHFGDSAAHPRIRVGAKGLEIVEPGE